MKTSVEKTKNVVLKKHEFEYEHVSRRIALFGISGHLEFHFK